MRVIVKTKNLDVTAEELQSFIEEKISSIKKFISILKEDEPLGQKTLAEVFVELEKETMHHKKGNIFQARAQVNLPGKVLTAKAEADDLTKAIVAVKNELKHEIKRYKERKISISEDRARKIKNIVTQKNKFKNK
jgi:ribosomal subunit interface protein